MTATFSLMLKRAAASRTSSEWREDDYDVAVDGIVVGRIMKAITPMQLQAIERAAMHVVIAEDYAARKLAGGLMTSNAPAVRPQSCLASTLTS